MLSPNLPSKIEKDNLTNVRHSMINSLSGSHINLFKPAQFNRTPVAMTVMPTSPAQRTSLPYIPIASADRRDLAVVGEGANE